jgi:hypothetical protein
MPDEGFLARWSRRKAQAESGVPAAAPQADLLPEGKRELNEASLPPAGAGAGGEGHEQAAPPPPTLDDVAQLNLESDFRRFVAPTVDPTVKNAALKKLFADPHFNAMDGLDVYIDDYSQPNPIPAALLRQLVQARGLGLFDQERSPDQASPDGAASARAPESAKEVPAVPPDENPDLQLQQDDAAGRGGAEERPPA